MRARLVSLLVTVAALSAAPELCAQSSAPPAKREGTFLLSGTLVNAEKAPLGGWTVYVGEVGAKDTRFSGDGLIYRGFAGEGTTRPDGHFEFPVQRAYFKGREIAFGLSVMGPDNGAHVTIKAKQREAVKPRRCSR
jgi:hypothetical protein